MYDHYLSIERQTRKKPKELEFPEYDATVSHILDYFWRIKAGQGQLITYQEIKAFSELLNIDLRSWQIETIIKIDRVFESAVR